MAASTQPLTHPANASLLALFAGRVAAEMERAQTERELRKSEEHLRQVQRVDAIGRLAGGVAHDFNNLLMIMIGYGEILRDRDGASQEITELLAAANRATVLTKQLLAFGRRQVLRGPANRRESRRDSGAVDVGARDRCAGPADHAHSTRRCRMSRRIQARSSRSW